MARSNKDSISDFHDYGIHVPSRTIQFPYIEGDCDISQASVNRTIANFHLLETMSMTSPITLLLNSYGGDVYQALGLYDFIRSLHSEVHIKALGACMSGATLILQAGDKRLISANTTFMMHVGTEDLGDHQKNVYRWAVHGEKVVKPRMKDIYASKIIRKTNESENQLSKRIDSLLDFDTILTADQVIALGLADDLVSVNYLTK